MTTTASIVYAGAGTITLTSSGLASTAGLLAGRASTAVDNSSTKNVDFLVGGKLVTTATTTTNTVIQIWAYGSYDGTTYTGGITGSDANITLDTGAKNLLKMLCIIPNITTTAVTYAWGPYSVAQAFGGVCPIKWGIYIVQNTGTALAAGGETKYTPVNYQSA